MASDPRDAHHEGHCAYCREFIRLFDCNRVKDLSEMEDLILMGQAYRRQMRRDSKWAGGPLNSDPARDWGR